MNNQEHNLHIHRDTIPIDVYKPIKRCQYCQSVYMTEIHCEACGRSMLYHPIGEPFSGKSFYGMKERYCDSLPLYVRLFPFFENKDSHDASYFVRQINKRLNDLLEAFTQEQMIAQKHRRFFYIETMELIDTLLSYGAERIVLEKKLERNLAENTPLLFQALLEDLQLKKDIPSLRPSVSQKILAYKFYGLKIDFILKAFLISATTVAVAVTYYEIISLQFGK